MNLTDLKDRLVIALTDRLEKPKAPRSRKPPEFWPAGTRFMVRSRYYNRRHGDDRPEWELNQLASHPRWPDETAGAAFHQLGSAEVFVRILMASEPVRDIEAISASYDMRGKAILERLVLDGAVTLDQVEKAAADLRAEWDAESEAAYQKEEAERAAKVSS